MNVPIEDKIYELRGKLRNHIDKELSLFVDNLTEDELCNIIMCSKGTISLYKHYDITNVKRVKYGGILHFDFNHSSGSFPLTLAETKNFVKDILSLRFF